MINRKERKHPLFYYKEEECIAKIITDQNSIYQFTDFGIRKVKNNMCPTLTANMGTYPNRVPVLVDDYGIRKMTLRECLDLQGFSRQFQFPTSITFNDAYKQIGNSVVVPVIDRIVKKITETYI